MQTLAKHLINRGFFATTNPVQQPLGSLALGSRNYLRLDQWRAWKGLGGYVGAGTNGSPYMANTPDGLFGGLDKGSIIGLIGLAIGFIGSGTLYLDGASRAVSGSTALQILLRRLGSYFGAGTGPYTAGLEPPTAPTIAEHSVTTSTINSGTTSARIWFVRSATGGRSRASSPSATIVVSGKKVRLTVQSADLTYAASVGADRIGIGLPQWGFGFSGPHYELIEIAISSLTTVDGVANSYEIEYSSADLFGKSLAPIDDYPPPAGVFAAAIEDVIAVIGCYGDVTSGVTAATPGSGIAVSLPVYIESFPPDNLLFLPEAPVGVLSRAADGFCFVGCKNSMHALLYTGGSPALSLRTIWPNTGIPAPNCMTLGEAGRLYALTSDRGLVRIGEDGEPQTGWAEPVAQIVAGWNHALTVMGYDDDHRLLVLINGDELLAYNTYRDEWSTPLDSIADTSPVGMVTVGGSLIIAYTGGVAGVFKVLGTFNQGGGSVCIATLPSVLSPSISDDIHQVLGVGRFDIPANAVTVRVFRDGGLAGSGVQFRTFNPTGTGPQHFPQDRLRFNARDCRSHQIQIEYSSLGGDMGIDYVEVRGVSRGIV
jgi:hypothetical protein